MKKVLKYSDRIIELESYRTIIEKEILLIKDTAELDDIFLILSNNIKSNIPLDNLSTNEKLNILIELRGISVGETFQLITKCTNCNEAFEFETPFNIDLRDKGIKEFKGIKLKEAFSTENDNYILDDLESIDLDLYDEVLQYIEENKINFNFEKEIECIHCQSKNKIKLTQKLILDNLSEDSIQNFFEVVSSMVYFGHYTLSDINDMYPFERSIYLNMLNEQIKKDNQNKSGLM